MKKRLLVIALALVLGISSVNRVFAASGVIIVPNMQIASYIKNAGMFVIHTHGSPTELKAVNSLGQETYLTYSEMQTWSLASVSSLKLAFLAACQTAGGGASAQNLTNLLFQKGGDCVIGYLNSVDTYCNYSVINAFCTAIGHGYTVAESLAYADSIVLIERGWSGYTQGRVVRGDTSLYLSSSKIMLGIPDEPINDGAQLMGSISEDGTVRFYDDTRLCGEFDFSKLKVNSASNVSTAQILNIEENSINDAELHANQFVDDINKYKLTDSYFTEETKLYTYIYQHFHDGIPTNDVVFMMFNSDGDVVSWGTPNKDRFDNVDISCIDWSDVYAKMSQSVAEMTNGSYEIVDERLVWDSNVLSMRFSVEIEIDGYLVVETINIPVR